MRTLRALLLSAAVALAAAATPSCSSVLAKPTTFTGECENDWADLKQYVKPTQPQVGYAWVHYKVDKDFSTEADAQAAMDESATPAVLGAEGIYVVDDHHTLSALDASGYSAVTVTINVLCDLRHLSESDFWAYLAGNNMTFLFVQPAKDAQYEPLPWSSMPSSFSFTSKSKTLSDSPWRSLVGFSRKVKTAPSPAPTCSSYKYCERCFIRGCGDGSQSSGPSVPFFEFRWAYYMLEAYVNDTWWDDSDAYTSFAQAYDALPWPSVMGQVDTDAWLEAAALLIPLCRGDKTGGYALPSGVFPGTTSMPGYVQGYGQLDGDPTCSAPVCPSSGRPFTGGAGGWIGEVGAMHHLRGTSRAD